jgi:WD40-like Beta Propeller Repeat
VRNAECGMRNCREGSNRRLDLPLILRIPHSAFRIFLLVLLPARAAAQADPSGSWRTLHTPHFRIHFRPAYREIALLEAREAERSYGLLVTELHPPRGVVDLTLADDIDAANGFTTVFPTPRITINAAPPAGDHGLLLFDDWLRLVTTHELTHVFHLDRAKGLWGVAQDVLGRAPGLFPNEYQPSWVIEGLATYYESRFTNGGRVRGSFHTQLLAADRAGGLSRSPWNATLFTRWADGLVPYAYGSRFFHYLASVAGDSVVPRFVEATASQLIPFRVGRQVARVAPGRSLAGEWPRGTRPAQGTGTPPGGARTLDSLLRSAPLPRVSPDGRRVAYLRDDGKGALELRVLDAVTLRPLAAHSVTGGVDYDWVGDTLQVVQLDFTSRWRIRSDLYHWVPGGKGGGWRRATHDARLVAPAGGGGRLAAIVLGPGAARPTIPTPAASAASVWEDVAISPDGRWVAGSRVAGGRRALVLWPADSLAAAAVLFETRGSVADVVWTSEGELWFVADPTGFPQVYRWTDEGTAVPLTSEPLGARAPAPLGDGSLLYAGLTARGWTLRRAPVLSGGTPVAFLEPLAFGAAPAVPVVETGYTMWPSLLPHFWLPFVLNAGPSGRFVGAVTAGVDALARFQYVAEGFVAVQPLRAAGSVALVSDVLGNPRLDLSASSTWLDLLPPPAAGARGLILSELDQDAGVGITFATRRWRRAATLRVGVDARRTHFATIPDTALGAVCAGCVPQDLIGASVTLGVSRVVSAPLAISREDGFAWLLRARRWEEQGSTRWSNELGGLLDLYAHVPAVGGFAHHVLAVRLAAGGLSGPLGARYQVGGVSSGVLGVAFGQPLGAARSFPVRGYRSDELSGARAASGSVEYRVPLALIGRALGHLPLGADKLWLNVFADAGDAWAPGAAPRFTRLRATGAELAADVAVSYDVLLALRLGVATPLADPPSGAARRPQVYVALASDF